MFKRLAILMVLAGVAALAQDDADIPPRFRNLITPEQYFQMRDQYLNWLRGLPADPSLRANSVRQLQTQQQSLKAPTVPWIPLGPSPIPNVQVTGGLPVTGRVTAFEIDPASSNKVYLGTAQGGVYRSLNGGTSYGEWGSIFGDPIPERAATGIATAILNRLLHHSTTVNIRGESYRLKQPRKAGLLPTRRAREGARFPKLRSPGPRKTVSDALGVGKFQPVLTHSHSSSRCAARSGVLESAWW